MSHERLTRICFVDYDREMALVADPVAPEGERSILGVVRMSKLHGLNEARFTVLINDASQGQGIGTELMRRIVEVAKNEHLDRLSAIVAPDNTAVQTFLTKRGFTIGKSADGELLEAEMRFQ